MKTHKTKKIVVFDFSPTIKGTIPLHTETIIPIFEGRDFLVAVDIMHYIASNLQKSILISKPTTTKKDKHFSVFLRA